MFARFNGIDAAGTIDFSGISVAPISVYPIGQANFGKIHPNGGRNPSIDSTGQVATFTTTGNLGFLDDNREGVDPDVYYSLPTGNFQVRTPSLLYPGSSDQSSQSFGINTSSISNWNLSTSILERASFVGVKRGLASSDRANTSNDVPDLMVRVKGSGWEAINLIAEDIPSTLRVTDGGITPDGRWAWWTTGERYIGVEVAQGSQVLYRRRVDSDNTGVVATVVGSPTTAEFGGKATFAVKLSSQRTVAEVVVNITSSDRSEGIPNTEQLTFTAANWSPTQTATVRGWITAPGTAILNTPLALFRPA